MFIAQFDHFGPCMPGQPKWSSCVSGNELLPMSVVTTGSRPSLGERPQLVAGVGVERPSADIEHGPLCGGGVALRGPCYLAGCPFLRRLPARQVDRSRVLEVELGLLDVPRDVDEHRPTAPRAGDVERGLQDMWNLVDVLHEPRVLDERES